MVLMGWFVGVLFHIAEWRQILLFEGWIGLFEWSLIFGVFIGLIGEKMFVIRNWVVECKWWFGEIPVGLIIEFEVNGRGALKDLALKHRLRRIFLSKTKEDSNYFNVNIFINFSILYSYFISFLLYILKNYIIFYTELYLLYFLTKLFNSL